MEKRTIDTDPQETKEWLDSVEEVLEESGQERLSFLLKKATAHAERLGARQPFSLITPYINTVQQNEQKKYPGERKTERRIKSLIRWNAMAMVVRANNSSPGIGGHISTYASSATLLEVAFNHYLKGEEHPNGSDLVFFQGHSSPGIYARAFLEGRLSKEHLKNFRRELAKEGGLSSYPHPWLMPEFWQFATVSMGLGPLMAIYQARFMNYLIDRGGKTKILFNPETKQVLGAGIVGQGAGDLVSEIALAIEMGADAEDLRQTIHPHPTLSETIRNSAETFLGTATDIFVPKTNKQEK